ncbi:DUF6491 family protein [Hyphomonas sp. BRH_c22]|uniref:DUF6491 family protein n=1 Tax=Hyphomonas sp. BRH_c22 TaxID=1629710 RepID=UPI000AF76AA7|nr:DUF6491 family protein [Hyphomonas sp. BRH_c22]
MRLALLAAASVLLTACASQAPADAKPKGVAQFAGDPRLGEEVRNVCFTSTISGFHDATDDTVVISKGRDDYLVEVYGNCFNLDQAQQIAVDSTTNCLGKGDHLITSDSISGFHDDTGFGVQRCMIKSVHKWDSKAKAPEETEETE